MDPDSADLSLVAAQEEAADLQTARRLPRQLNEGVGWPAESQQVSARASAPHDAGRAATGAYAPRSAVNVLADRLAAALVHHEPGWRLPRHSALARRYSVSTAEVDAAIDELISRHLIRRLADGQLYRASPAEYIFGLEGVPGLTAYVDAMGGEFTCRSRQVTWRMPPEEISWALRLPVSDAVCVVRFLWTAGGEPAAFSTTYVPGDIADRRDASSSQPLPVALSLLELTGVVETAPMTGVPSALHVEMQAPPPSVARSLRLSAGQPAMMITVRFDDAALGRPVALTTAVLRADMFRLVLQSPEPPLPTERAGNLADSWTGAAEGWQP